MAEQEVGLQSMFGTPDRKGNEANGEVQSEYPAHMMNAQIDTLDNDINELTADLNGGRIPGNDIFEAKEELALLQGKFDAIVISKPQYSPSEETFLQKELDRMTVDMQATLYSRFDQHKGKGSIARPQQEADLNDKPCIDISPEIARICNINGVVRGKVSRNQIDKARKILCAYFNRDDASREAIRPENRNGRGATVTNFANFAFEKRAKELYGENYRTHKEIFGTDNKPNSPINQLGGEDTAESIQTEIEALKNKIARMEGAKEVDPNVVKTEAEIPIREVKAGKQYICPEPDCGFVGKMTQKGAHIRMHNKEKAKLAAELKEE